MILGQNLLTLGWSGRHHQVNLVSKWKDGRHRQVNLALKRKGDRIGHEYQKPIPSPPLPARDHQSLCLAVLPVLTEHVGTISEVQRNRTNEMFKA